jgi:hypothetical protein
MVLANRLRHNDRDGVEILEWGCVPVRHFGEWSLSCNGSLIDAVVEVLQAVSFGFGDLRKRPFGCTHHNFVRLATPLPSEHIHADTKIQFFKFSFCEEGSLTSFMI